MAGFSQLATSCETSMRASNLFDDDDDGCSFVVDVKLAAQPQFEETKSGVIITE